MYISWHFPDYTFFISIIPVVEQVCFFLSDIYLLSLLTALPYLLPNQIINLLLFFVSGSLMKISSKIGPSADPQKVHLKNASRQEGPPIVWSIPICLLRGSFGPDSFLAIPSHSVFGENSPCGSLYEMLSSSPKRWESEHCLSGEYNFCYKNKKRLS